MSDAESVEPGSAARAQTWRNPIRWTASRSALCPRHASTVCHLPAPSLNLPRHSVRCGQCWAWPVPLVAWIILKHCWDRRQKQLA